MLASLSLLLEGDGVTLETLRFTSCQAPVAEAFCAGVARHIGEQLGIATTFVGDVPWQERLQQFDTGRIHVCWMCGLPYVRRAGGEDSILELLAAPVMAASRYADQPVYFSDVVVLRDGPCRSFADLASGTWAYNEATSHSGYTATRCLLAKRGYTSEFFGKVVATGSHEASLDLLLEGEVHGSAIDSTVLDLLTARDPNLESRLRVVEVFGPSPIPPWVIAKTVPPAVRAAVRSALLSMSDDARGRAVLASGRAARFVRVTDTDYNPIRSMTKAADRVQI